MKLLQFLIFCHFVLIPFEADISNLPDALQQKLEKAIGSTFETEAFEITEIDVTAYPIADKNVHIFSINNDEKLLGYAYLSQANSKHDVYDYVVLYDQDFKIKKSKILIYREKYGRQVGSQRWLKQFIGFEPGETFDYGKDISAVSGATITATSMTKAIQKSLKDIGSLKNEVKR